MLAFLCSLCHLPLGARAGESRYRDCQVILPLNEFGGLHGHERRTCADDIAQLGEQFRHSPRVGREHRCRRIVVVGDHTVGDLLAAERHRLDRRNLQRLALGFRGKERARCGLRRNLVRGGGPGRAMQQSEREQATARQRHDDDGDERPVPEQQTA